MLVTDVTPGMLETKCVGDNYKMLVTAFAILFTNIDYHEWINPSSIIYR